MAYRDTVKPWFQTGDKPTQAQFYQLFDYLFFKDEGITMADVAGLVAALAGKASQAVFDDFQKGELIETSADVIYAQGANTLIEKIIIIPGADAAITIGTTNGGEEIMVSTNIEVTDYGTYPFIIDAFSAVDRNLYINGIPANSKIIILKRPLKIA